VRVSIEFDRDYDETIADMEAGDVFGWSSLVEPYLRTATARCAVASEVVGFDGTALRKLIASDPRLGCLLMAHIAQVLASRLQDAYVRLASFVSV